MWKRLWDSHRVLAPHTGIDTESTGSGGEDAGKGRRVLETEYGAAMGSAQPGDIKPDLRFPEKGGGGGKIIHAIQHDPDLRGGGSAELSGPRTPRE